jgi:hypothetical protein
MECEVSGCAAIGKGAKTHHLGYSIAVAASILIG